MIEIKNLTKKYSALTGIKNINLNIGEGEIIGLFGANGAGKTTLMKCLFNFLKYEGQILIDGEKLGRNNVEKLAFASCEHTFFPNLKAEAHAEFYEEHFPKFNRKRFRGLMEFFDISYHQPIGKMSLGQQNQFEVILALSQGAKYIIMDEPFTGNDIFNREDFYKVLLGILEPDETILLSTHLIEEVSGFVGRAVVIKDGSIVEDVDVDDLAEQGETLTEYIKKVYDYQPDRVGKALDTIIGSEE